MSAPGLSPEQLVASIDHSRSLTIAMLIYRARRGDIDGAVWSWEHVLGGLAQLNRERALDEYAIRERAIHALADVLEALGLDLSVAVFAAFAEARRERQVSALDDEYVIPPALLEAVRARMAQA